MTISIRAHELDEMQRRLKGVGADVTKTHGAEIEENVRLIVNEIKGNPNVSVEITDQFGSICSDNCKIRAERWHHCSGPEIEELENREAKKHKLEIGERRPAREIFEW